MELESILLFLISASIMVDESLNGVVFKSQIIIYQFAEGFPTLDHI